MHVRLMRIFSEQECDLVTDSARMNKSNFTTERII